MKRYTYLFFCLTVLLGVCACEKDSNMYLPLAVDSRKIVLESTGGTTEVQIYSTYDWQVAFDEQVDWASLDRLKGTGNDFIRLSYAPNYDIHRAVTLLINANPLKDTVRFIQKGNAAVLNFTGSATAEADTTAARISLNTNLENHFDEVEVIIEYQKYLYDDEDDEDVPEPVGGWISDVSLYSDRVECKFSANVGADRPRKAAITLQYTDVYETLFTTSTTLVQNN